MRDSTTDTVDYIVTVAVMNWLINAGWDTEEIRRVVALADRAGQGICDHYTAGQAKTYDREIPRIEYRWRPVYEVMLEPAVRQIFTPGQGQVDTTAVIDRLSRLHDCLQHLIPMCERSPEWETSESQKLATQMSETLQSTLERMGAPVGSDRTVEAWTRDLIPPTSKPVADAVGDDHTNGRS
ncbi:hypothetical protein [Agromyces bauzanensis]